MRCIACGKDLVVARMAVSYDVGDIPAAARCHPGLERDEHGRLRILTCGDCAVQHFGSMAEPDWDEKLFQLLGAYRHPEFASMLGWTVDTGLTLAQAVQRYVELRREEWCGYRAPADYYIRGAP